MCEITYNVKINFENQEDYIFWFNLLSEQKNMLNYASDLIYKKKPKLDIKTIANLIYNPIRKKSKYLNAQCVCKIEREILGIFRSIKSNKNENKLKQAPIKKNLCMRLDKRLYSKFSKNGIYLISNKSMKRCFATLCLYPKIEKLFNSYPTSDPLIFFKNNEFYLSVSFKLPEQAKQNENTLGIDLGCRRLITTSNGDAIKSTDYLRQKRKIRYLKRILNSKKKNSHSARTKLKKIKHKEHNYSKQYIEKTVNCILKNSNESNIAIEDLTKIKKKKHIKNTVRIIIEYHKYRFICLKKY